MIFVLNIILAVLAFYGSAYLLTRMGIPGPVATLLAVLVAIVVFFANVAARIV